MLRSVGKTTFLAAFALAALNVGAEARTLKQPSAVEGVLGFLQRLNEPTATVKQAKPQVTRQKRQAPRVTRAAVAPVEEWQVAKRVRTTIEVQSSTKKIGEQYIVQPAPQSTATFMFNDALEKLKTMDAANGDMISGVSVADMRFTLPAIPGAQKIVSRPW